MRQLGGHEQVFSPDVTGRHGLSKYVSEMSFGAVAVGAVEVIETGIKRRGQGQPGLLGQESLHVIATGPVAEGTAEADHGDPCAVTQFESGNCHDFS